MCENYVGAQKENYCVLVSIWYKPNNKYYLEKVQLLVWIHINSKGTVKSLHVLSVWTIEKMVIIILCVYIYIISRLQESYILHDTVKSDLLKFS